MTEVVPTLGFEPTMSVAHAGRLLRRVEAHHDRAGWHHTAHVHVYAVYDHHDVVTATMIRGALHTMGPGISNSRYTAQALLTPREFEESHRETGSQDYETLFRFAYNMAYVNTDDVRDGKFASTLKTYSRTADRFAWNLDIFRQVLRMPGLLGFIHCGELVDECGHSARLAVMVDMHDRVHRVFRHEGEPAMLELAVDDRASVITSLRVLTDITQGRVPAEGDAFMDRYAYELTEVDGVRIAHL